MASEQLNLIETLNEHERAWVDRPVVRELYHRWFELIRDHLSPVSGPTVELGGGLGHIRTVIPDVVVTDIEPTPWADALVDAQHLPYENGTIANLILFDVFHHLPVPARFLDEATRVLRPGGRVVALEPYCSLISTLAYRRLHHEPVELAVDPFSDTALSSDEAMDSNTALPTLTFFRQRGEFERRWPQLSVQETRRLAFLAYPLSGGFSRRPLLPLWALPLLRVAEAALCPFSPLLAFRALIVLERS